MKFEIKDLEKQLADMYNKHKAADDHRTKIETKDNAQAKQLQEEIHDHCVVKEARVPTVQRRLPNGWGQEVQGG